MTPKELHSYLGRVLYNKRNKFDPFWNDLIVGGYRDGKPFLGSVDMWGTTYEDNIVANGMAMHLCLAILRKEWTPELCADEAKALLEKCMQVMFYRNCRSSPSIQIATITAGGVQITEPYKIETNWRLTSFQDTRV